MSELDLSMTAEDRKREEAEFHDRLRGLYERDPQAYARFTSNKKYYLTAGKSSRFYAEWVAAHAAGKRVLDYGCGNGFHTVRIAERAAHVVAIDISPEAVRQTAERAAEAGLADRVTAVVMDGENLELPSGSIDVVCVNGVLHHIDLPAALAQISRVMAPDGRGIFLEALANNPLIHAYRRRTPHLRTEWETAHILRAESAEVMREYFHEVEVRFFHLASLAAVALRGTPAFGAALRVLDALDALLLRIPGVRKQAWMGCFLVARPRTPQAG